MTDEWYTPPHVVAALELARNFGLDPAASPLQPFRTARRYYTKADNGLVMPWDDEDCYVNPPYSLLLFQQFLAKLAAHGRGLLLTFARTDTDAFHTHVWPVCDAVFFFRHRLCFYTPAGTRGGRARDRSMLCAYGPRNAELLAGCGLDGKFVPLKFARGVLVAALSTGWRQAIAAFLRAHDGPVALDTLYRAFATHPKARSNRTFAATIRRTLQEGAGRRVGRGLYEAV